LDHPRTAQGSKAESQEGKEMSNSEHFKNFAKTLEAAIEKYGGVEEITLVARQKEQVEKLVALEKKFRRTLIKHPWGPGVYKSFIDLIIRERKNILAARPYFRERQDVFTSRIAKCLKGEKPKALYKFHFNYQFVRFVIDSRKWPKGGKIVRLGQEIEQIRTELVEMNMPLAISRARIFWSKTPKSHLSYMDLVQISCEGLMSAIDKFVLPYSKVFRAVAIGRIIGELIENYSETLVHFYPQDKRKIYRANKRMNKHADGVDFERLASEINEGIERAQMTDASEISGLVAAASHVSTDSHAPTEENTVTDALDKFAADATVQPDVTYEEYEAAHALHDALHVLTPFERKVLRLKGIGINAIGE
jgi:RNA polymerase sigma factor (sigma-70 family)